LLVFVFCVLCFLCFVFCLLLFLFFLFCFAITRLDYNPSLHSPKSKTKTKNQPKSKIKIKNQNRPTKQPKTTGRLAFQSDGGRTEGQG